jgi:hypothetical protein
MLDKNPDSRLKTAPTGYPCFEDKKIVYRRRNERAQARAEPATPSCPTATWSTPPVLVRVEVAIGWPEALVATLTTMVPEGAEVVAGLPLVELTVTPPPPAAVERVLVAVLVMEPAPEEVREPVARVPVADDDVVVKSPPSSPPAKSTTQLDSWMRVLAVLQQLESEGR